VPTKISQGDYASVDPLLILYFCLIRSPETSDSHDHAGAMNALESPALTNAPRDVALPSTIEAGEIPVLATRAAHHWQAKLRLVLHLGSGKHFTLLSYDDGASVIHEAIDEWGNVGGDWWGQAHSSSLEQSLEEFARTEGLSIDSLWAAISAVESTECDR
jgi:hypothetical protein